MESSNKARERKPIYHDGHHDHIGSTMGVQGIFRLFNLDLKHQTIGSIESIVVKMFYEGFLIHPQTAARGFISCLSRCYPLIAIRLIWLLV